MRPRRHGVSSTALFLVSWLISIAWSLAAADIPKQTATMTQSAVTSRSLEGPFPNPNLAAEGVVRTQMQALQNNDIHDRGIEITYRFAPPANKRKTGPIERFARMLKTSP